jgi:hypothetical protein
VQTNQTNVSRETEKNNEKVIYEKYWSEVKDEEIRLYSPMKIEIIRGVAIVEE